MKPFPSTAVLDCCVLVYYLQLKWNRFKFIVILWQNVKSTAGSVYFNKTAHMLFSENAINPFMVLGDIEVFVVFCSFHLLLFNSHHQLYLIFMFRKCTVYFLLLLMAVKPCDPQQRYVSFSCMSPHKGSSFPNKKALKLSCLDTFTALWPPFGTFDLQSMYTMRNNEKPEKKINT